MSYLKVRCETILDDLGYKYNENDVKNIIHMFNKEYNDFFEEYQNWWNVIDKYYAEHYGEK